MKVIYRKGDVETPVIKYKKPSMTERAIILAEQLKYNQKKRILRRMAAKALNKPI